MAGRGCAAPGSGEPPPTPANEPRTHGSTDDRARHTETRSGTLLVLAAAHVIGGSPDGRPSAMVLLVAGAVLVPQWPVSTLWLRRHRQGPLERLWRWATRARRPPLRRTSDHGARPRLEEGRISDGPKPVDNS
ncbi:DUF418 domain-containing protein [Planomonospora parontospora]|uniref:DUF418 domain-containing protein n=1 Tax=Planomonospora parontospora TaxID=58119 RepID=UPI001984D8BC|nr:DUF418 domain-containing protein [Planomonospora parontospora]GGL30000.1 hypothetical protein GCM10014719_34190 [Planomonospora parontospora subsp. antibiotica]GII17759.1 hypothetical protein Ppa05_44850 [Planomonospora parontospora subsp. antibiotica]